MANQERLPAAQYLRMSTEHQQYSLQNQSAAIRGYAEAHGFEVTKTFSDSGRTGLILRNRPGLQELIRDVVSGAAAYKAVLVYDVSRWGRFQDTDESAHYEFLCRSAGVPVHYCAETFANDGSMPSLIMKALKRTMAGEYSRELGVRVLAGQSRLVRLGYKMGGMPGFGLRRMMISSSGQAKQPLALGEHKSLVTDRVVLVPGPASEIATIKKIYRMFLEDNLKVRKIACELNRQGVGYLRGSRWDYSKVSTVLSHPKYIGWSVFRQTTSSLHTPTVRMPRSEWVIKRNAFEPIVDETTFLAAQKLLAERTIQKTDEQLLDMLRRLLAEKGRLSLKLIMSSEYTPSPNVYRRHFGNMGNAYKLIGYDKPESFGTTDMRRRIQAARNGIMAQIVSLSSRKVMVVSRGRKIRTRLRIRNGRAVSVIAARCFRPWHGRLRWDVAPNIRERRLVTLVARLNEDNASFMDFHLLPMPPRKRIYIALDNEWLAHGIRLRNLSKFCECVSAAARRRSQ